MFKAGDKFKVIGNSKNKYGEHCFDSGDIVELVGYVEKANGKKSKKYILVSKISNPLEQAVKLKDLQCQNKE